MRKLFHKHITQRVRRLPRHFTKYLYERDTILATIWVFIFIVGLGSIPLNLGVVNPIKLSLKDFDFNDLTYAKLGKSEKAVMDKDIVIVNIGDADRAKLSFIINAVASYKPKVMGLDALFSGERDPEGDSLLRAALGAYPNLVVVDSLYFEGEEIIQNDGYFKDVPVKRGYANLWGGESHQLITVRLYPTYIKKKKLYFRSFGSVLLEQYDPAAYKRVMDRKKKLETLNYSRHTNQYSIIDADQLLTDGVDSGYLKNKLVLLGYINPSPNNIEDKFFTPLNENFIGKSIPDMNGVVIHANFISMVLADDYIKKVPSWVNWLVAVLIGWLHMSFFIRYYLESHIWFHLVAKIAQVASAIFFVFLGSVLFDKYNIKLDMKYTLITIALAVDVIYFYEAFAVWMHKKFHYHTVFHQKHH
jgi:CHASE2 domain-containing sensor protein